MRNWYYIVGTDRKGPVPEAQLRALLTSGNLTGATQVWTEGMPNWAPASSTSLLTAGTPRRPVPVPPPPPPVAGQPQASAEEPLSDRLHRIGDLRGLDPLREETRRRFEELMEEVLRDRSVKPAQEIVQRPTPVPPPGLPKGATNPDFQQLMVEHATIRMELERQKAAGPIEENRLRTAVREWISGADALRGQPRPDTTLLERVREAFSRAVLILDSIERRDISALQRAIVRFDHLRRRLGMSRS